MKNILLLIIIGIFSTGNTFAQERETLVGNGDIAHGGMGGMMIKSGMIKDELNILVGGKGAYLMDHRLYIGGAGYGTSMMISANGTEYAAGFGGMMMGYKFFPHKLVHVGVETVVGSGGLSEVNTMNHDMSYNHHGGDAFFYAEPSVYAAFNIAPFFTIHTGVSYRYVKGTNTTGFSDADFRNYNLEISMLWGKF
ncbi:MAG: hypothetical protein OEZ43_16040 [Gammaproteobacteria bacterium]|nr:hypothetical protein [Gammaproteobacteria bacterium]